MRDGSNSISAIPIVVLNSTVYKKEAIDFVDFVTSVKGKQEVIAARYLATSITSETEFVITNGRGKMLRLPMGNYSYTLQALPITHSMIIY